MDPEQFGKQKMSVFVMHEKGNRGKLLSHGIVILSYK